MVGFQGKSCLKAAAEIVDDLQRLGVVAKVEGIKMKDLTEPIETAQQTALKLEEG